MTLDNLRFEFRVVDKETGEVIVSDFTTLTTIDSFGNCESVDIHVGAAMRCVRSDMLKAAHNVDG